MITNLRIYLFQAVLVRLCPCSPLTGHDRTILLVLQCVIIGCLPVVVLFTYKYSHLKVIKAASPVLLRIIILGAFFIYSTVSVVSVASGDIVLNNNKDPLSLCLYQEVFKGEIHLPSVYCHTNHKPTKLHS